MSSRKKAAKTIEPWDCDGLRISVRGRTFHVVGTLRVGKRSQRVRETLGVVAAWENKSEAERQAREIVRRVRAELGGGVTRRAVATLVAERFKAHIGPSDRRILEDFTAKFTTRILFDIPTEEIIQFVEDRQRCNKAETRERYISQLCAFLNLQIPKGQYPALPPFKRDQRARNPLKRARRDVQQFRVQLLQDIIACSHISLGAQLDIEYAAGARVSSLLQGCTLGDLDMTTLTLTLRDTKNGDDVPAALPTSMRPRLEDYLEWRQLQVRRRRIGPGSHEPLFLHHKGRPYKPNGGAWGTQNRKAFNNAKLRAIESVGKRYDEAIATMRLAGDQREVERLMRLKADDLALLRRITQHWLRHKFATEAGRKDMRAAMAQGGWRDPRSIAGYLIADAEFQRAIVEERGSPAAAARGT
jgi:site-specific recombinase XerD